MELKKIFGRQEEIGLKEGEVEVEWREVCGFKKPRFIWDFINGNRVVVDLPNLAVWLGFYKLTCDFFNWVI